MKQERCLCLLRGAAVACELCETRICQMCDRCPTCPLFGAVHTCAQCKPRQCRCINSKFDGSRIAFDLKPVRRVSPSLLNKIKMQFGSF